MFVPSKVRVTVVRLNRIFLTGLNAWPTIWLANVRTNELFVLSEFVFTRFDCTWQLGQVSTTWRSTLTLACHPAPCTNRPMGAALTGRHFHMKSDIPAQFPAVHVCIRIWDRLSYDISHHSSRQSQSLWSHIEIKPVTITMAISQSPWLHTEIRLVVRAVCSLHFALLTAHVRSNTAQLLLVNKKNQHKKGWHIWMQKSHQLWIWVTNCGKLQ